MIAVTQIDRRYPTRVSASLFPSRGARNRLTAPSAAIPQPETTLRAAVGSDSRFVRMRGGRHVGDFIEKFSSLGQWTWQIQPGHHWLRGFPRLPAVPSRDPEKKLLPLAIANQETPLRTLTVGLDSTRPFLPMLDKLLFAARRYRPSVHHSNHCRLCLPQDRCALSSPIYILREVPARLYAGLAPRTPGRAQPCTLDKEGKHRCGLAPVGAAACSYFLGLYSD
jgi:hypothetical protein